MTIQKRTNKKGFSLIEVIVSIALFAVILTAALGSLLVIIDVNRQTKAIKLVVNNLNLAMEGMSRELRVGSNICDSDNGNSAPTASCNTVSAGVDTIFFTTDIGETSSRFRLNNDAIERRIGSGGTSLPLTGTDVTIEDMRFFIRGVGETGAEADVQPSVLIVIAGNVRQADQVVEFDLQTVVSQRKLEL